MDENRDPLTGLATWKHVQGILPGILNGNGQVALIFVDVDHFKDYNEFFGALRGDEKLVEIGRGIQSSSGEGALVFRFGGDEFGIILVEASLDDAREVAEGIRCSSDEVRLTLWDKTEYRMLTLSLGIAHFPTHVSNAENLLRAADLALMKAKGQGKRGGRWSDGTPYTGRNRAMAIGDFRDDFPEQSAEFLK